MGIKFKAIKEGKDLKIIVKYGDKEEIKVYTIGPSVRVQLNTSELTYNGSEFLLVTNAYPSDGIESYYLGYKKGSKADTDADITWGNKNVDTLKATNAGTYYIYYKYSVKEGVYGGDKPYTYVGTVKINTINAEVEVINKYIEVPYNRNSQEINLGDYIKSTSDVSFSKSVNVTYPDNATATWNCTSNGIVTIPGGTKGSSNDFKMEVNVTAIGDGENIMDTKNILLTWYIKIGYPLINITAKDDSDSDSDFDYTYPDYERLDDDVSFQVLRTNPKLTTNTKLLYDGKNMYMESYSAAPILSTESYKHFKVYGSGLFNKDLRKFLIGTDKTTYTVGQNVNNSVVLNNFDNQFENMYWCGVESINSNVYPQEMGCIAPLYLRKKRPNYFVIFKIDTPVNINYVNESDMTYDFKSDILKKAKIFKVFDLREGTPIGNYIKRYVEQKMFEYDRSIYVNFSSNEIYYYGIDKGTGVLTQKVENFEEQLLHNDNTIMKMDDWITSGFERNNLIFPYIINFEYLFDDKEIGEYKFARYFGMYCNDIDLYNLDVSDMIHSENGTNIIENWENVEIDNDKNNFKTSENEFYYIKDKNKNIYSIKSLYVPGYFKSPSKLDINDFTGFELTSVSTYAERISGAGHATMILDVYDKIENRKKIKIKKPIISDGSESDEIVLTFTASKNLTAGTFNQNNRSFSCKGNTTDVIKALVGLINACRGDEFELIYAYSIDNKVIIESIYPGSNMNEFIDVEFDSQGIRKLTNKFDGGTDVNGCRFKVYTSDLNMFFDYISGENEIDYSRYLRCGVGRNNSKILSHMPYINDGKIDDTYSILITDKYGPYVNISNTEEVEILDKFYSEIGVLSFFPIKDFDFDTVSSPYGNDDMIQQEFSFSNPEVKIMIDTGESDNSDEKYTVVYINNVPSYGRFFYHNGNTIDTEYEYFFENIIPELALINKTVPYITKWGYVDDSRDSCENIYRLNTSKIFETSNFSANTYVKGGDIFEYTHSMPYYINNLYDDYYNENNLKNEYQYIPVNSDLWDVCKDGNYDTIINTWVNYFLEEDKNNFEKMFGDASATVLDVRKNNNVIETLNNKSFNNKRFNKKYSRFLLGNDTNRSSTLFRGVKFEIEELDGNKEVHTGKFNNYKFSFIYVPINGDGKNKGNDKFTVHFIKNDKYKFIVGLVLFNIKNKLSERVFNKSFVYAGSMYNIK